MSTSEKLQIDVFVPESKVNSVIGTNGQQIASVQKNSNATISVQKKLHGMNDRPVRVIGKTLEARDAISSVYKMIFENKHPFESDEKKETVSNIMKNKKNWDFSSLSPQHEILIKSKIHFNWIFL